ncbi:MAG: substrate-binding domain-containing protein [bacterium]|nr:substrate-binding domain-containing protein [bacterium]
MNPGPLGEPERRFGNKKYWEDSIMKVRNLSRIAGSLFIASILTVSLWSCGGQNDQPKENASAPSDGKPVIAVVPKGTAHIFWQSVHSGAVKAGEEFGARIEWLGPQTETMKDQQISIVDDFITRGVDGIVLAPQDQNALVPVVERVAAAGIPCAIFDSGIATDKYLSFVATDNYKGGVKAAQEMARLLDNKGTCIITRVDPGSDSTIQREKGFEETLAKDYPDIKVVDAQYGYSDREKSRAVTEDMLTAHPDVDAVFGPNESSTFGALLALQARQMAGKKVFVGFDSSDELVEALRKGEIQALVLQDPVNMGYRGVEAIMKHLKGEEVPKRIDTGVYVVTAENMDQPDYKRLLEPELLDE